MVIVVMGASSPCRRQRSLVSVSFKPLLAVVGATKQPSNCSGRHLSPPAAARNRVRLGYHNSCRIPCQDLKKEGLREKADHVHLRCRETKIGMSKQELIHCSKNLLLLKKELKKLEDVRYMESNGSTLRYTSMLWTYVNTSDMERAEKCFRRMKKDVLQPNVVTYRTLREAMSAQWWPFAYKRP
ncbi:unnamed protein product [Lactuca virosa]|uniref:Pentatricopeptide repeat-containing protein n=1 Tax=Lactuca virosa TaxID=75947 RepID=A0AAU9NJA5_9ASTR|nr:unnamed protein product [Lactuca virosa]